MKTVSQHGAETRHKQDAPGHYTLVSCMRLRVECLCMYVVIVALVILNSRMMLVCYYRGRVAVLTMFMCYDRVLAMLDLCLLHVCSSLSSASALAVTVPLKGPPQPQPHHYSDHLFISWHTCQAAVFASALHGLLRLSVQHLRRDQSPDEKQRYMLCERDWVDGSASDEQYCRWFLPVRDPGAVHRLGGSACLRTRGYKE